MKFSDYAKPFSYKTSSDTGILVIHGFTSTPQSIEYYCKNLHKAGFNIEAPLLTGHATRWEDMNELTFNDWIKDVSNSYKNLKSHVSKVFAAGLSMGGTLALKAAELHKEIRGIILINHALFLKKDWRLPFVPIIMHIMASDAAKIGGDLKDPDAYELTYDRIPLKGTYQLMRLLKEVRKIHHKIIQPVLVFKSHEDHVIPVKCANYTMKHIASKEKELVWLENSFHVATLDYDKDIIIEKTIKFIDRYK